MSNVSKIKDKIKRIKRIKRYMWRSHFDTDNKEIVKESSDNKRLFKVNT